MAISNKKREKIVELIKSGMSSGDIAEKLGVRKMQVAGIRAYLTIKQRGKEGPSSSGTTHEIPLLWSNTPPPKGLTPATQETSILIGTDEIFGKKVYWNFSPETGSVNPHVLIIGETGSGKTYAAQCIAAELQKKGITNIIFDYGQAFSGKKAAREFIEIAEPKLINASLRGVAINPLQIFSDDIMGPVNVAQRTADTFCRIYPNMGIQQKEAVIEAIEKAFRSVNISAEERSSWYNEPPQFSKVQKMLREIAESDNHLLRSYAKTAYSHIRSFFRFNVIRNDGEQVTWQSIAEDGCRIWIIQLKGLDEYVSMIMTEMLLWHLISYLRSGGPSDLRFFVILDEAHKLSFDKGTPVDWMLREGRKFGLGVILASQHIEDYTKFAIANTATKLVFQNYDDRHAFSKSLATKCKNISDYRRISRLINVLERGKVFFLTQNIGRVLTVDELQRRR